MKLFTKTITFPEKEFREQIEQADRLVADLRSTLEEALDWISRPVVTQEDAMYFQVFEERARRLIS